MFFESGTTRRRFHAANIRRPYTRDTYVRRKGACEPCGRSCGKGGLFYRVWICWFRRGRLGVVIGAREIPPTAQPPPSSLLLTHEGSCIIEQRFEAFWNTEFEDVELGA